MALARTFSPSFSSCLLLQFFFVVGSSAGDVLSDAGNGMVSLDVVVSFSSSSGSETVSSLLSVPNDDSGMFLVMPIALFISEAFTAFVVCRW